MEVKNMIEKQPIVALRNSTKPKKARPPRNNLLLSLKKNDLELDFYSSLDPELMNKLLEKVLPWFRFSDLGQVYIVCGKIDLRKGIDGLATLVKEQFELDPFSGKSSSFAAEARTASKPLIGTDKVFGCSTKDLKMENWTGPGIKMKFKLYLLSRSTG